MKKFLGILIAFMAAALPLWAQAAGNTSGLLSELEIFPQSWQQSEEYITRGEFAYAAARLSGSGEQKAAKTDFSDVGEDNIYSGYIGYLSENGFVSGVEEGKFDPSGELTAQMAYKIAVDIMGRGAMARARGSYAEEAKSLGFEKYINSGAEKITKAQALRFLIGVCDLEYYPVSYSGGKPVVSSDSKKQTVLTDVLDISAYRAYVTAVDGGAGSIRIRIEKNLYDTNKNYLSKGAEYTVSSDGSIDVNNFEGAPVDIYVYNETDTVAAILLQNGVKIVYKNIYSVNGDTAKDSFYLPSAVKTISFSDTKGKYKLTDDAVIKYNEKKADEPVSLIGKAARVVLDGNDVIAINSWDFKEGGILSKISDEELTFVQGTNDSQEIKDFDKFKNKKIIIDGESADIKLLKANTYFDYYSEGDTIVICASEKVITDKLFSANDEVLSIGSAVYGRAESLYVKGKSGVYIKGGSMTDLFGHTVDAYFNHGGECVYIAASSLESVQYSDFLGAVASCIYEDEDWYVKLWHLEGEVKTELYTIADKVKLSDGITVSELKENAGSFSGKGIYLFKVNSKQEITSVSRPVAYPGFGAEARGTFSQTANDQNVYVAIGNKTVFLNHAPLAALYSDGGTLTACSVAPYQLVYKQIDGGADIILFGEEDSLQVRMAVVCGVDFSTIHDKETSVAFVTDKALIKNKDDELAYKISVKGVGGGEYSLSSESGDKVPSKAFIVFYKGAAFSDDDIILAGSMTVDLTGSSDSWTESGILKIDTIKRINSFAVEFESGEVYFLHPTLCSYAKYEQNKSRSSIESASLSDFNSGDTVCYYGIDTLRAMLLME